MTVSAKQLEYAKKYQAKLDAITIRVKAGTKPRWQAAADDAGQSLTAYIVKAVDDRIAGKQSD